MFWIGLLVVISLALVFAEEIALLAVLVIAAGIAIFFWDILSQWLLGLVLLAAMLAVGTAIVHLVNKAKARITAPPGRPY